MSNARHEPTDFSLVLGGPLYQLFIRSRLSVDALDHVVRRVVVISLVAWLPLLLLSALGGEVLGGTAAMPFLVDVEVHVRFLLAMPLLIAAELVVHQRMQMVLGQFFERNLIPESAQPRFNAAVEAVFRLRNSVVAEVLLIAIVYVVGVLIIWRLSKVIDTTSWYTVPAVNGSSLSPAGMWYEFVSLPVFQFLLLRWYPSRRARPGATPGTGRAWC